MQHSESKTLSEQIVDVLFEEAAFEDNPLTEEILADRLDKGRSQIRDALSRLETEGLVERRKKKGVYVTSPTPKVIAELYDIRMLLEGYAARQAVDTATEQEMDQLQLLADRFTEAARTRNYASLVHANTEFHQQLIHLSRNDMLIRMISSMNVVRKAFQYAYGLKPEEQRIGSEYTHERIVDSLRDRDAELAESLTRQHIQVGKERVLEQALGFKIKSV